MTILTLEYLNLLVAIIGTTIKNPPIGLETLDLILESIDLYSSATTDLVVITIGIFLILVSNMTSPRSFTIDEITETLISPEEFESLNPMMTGQSSIPAQEGKTSTQILKEASRLNKGLMTYTLALDQPFPKWAITPPCGRCRPKGG